MKVKFYTDPGHGWVAVKRNLLEDLGILNDITHYSYQRGQTVYLEEDCDLATFVTALARKGETIEYQESFTEDRSPIRSYDHFVA